MKIFYNGVETTVQHEPAWDEPNVEGYGMQMFVGKEHVDDFQTGVPTKNMALDELTFCDRLLTDAEISDFANL